MKKVTKLIHAAVLAAATLMTAVPVQAEGYWTDGWTDGSGVWHDVYWTETGGGDGCGWVVDWNNPDGGYCSYQSGQVNAASNQASAGVYTGAGNSLSIPGLGYSASLSTDGDPQWIVDQPGLGWYSWWDDGHMLIGDHAYQGLGKLGNLPNGATATLTIDGVQKTITKASGYSGYNSGYGLSLSDGRDMSAVWDGSIVIYTCAAGSSGSRVIITFWN